MDNRSHQEADWDIDISQVELGELKGLDLDLGVTGFDSRELDALLRQANSRETRTVRLIPEAGHASTNGCCSKGFRGEVIYGREENVSAA